MRTGKLLLAFTLLATAVSAAEQKNDEAARKVMRPVHTYSIVARDAETGQLGVAVQTHWFAVGSRVVWAEAGVGAVATQSFTDPSYGKLGLDLMRAGKSAREALRGLLATDGGSPVRQVAMVDADGKVMVWTGSKNIPAAGHSTGLIGTTSPETGRGPGVGAAGCGGTGVGGGCWSEGEGYSVQANLMERDTVWLAMATAFRAAQGDLAERMLIALEAAEGEGGDIRGKQSAALVVVSGTNTGKPWVDRIFDVRVDDHPEPLKELRRLVGIERAYNHMNAGDEALEAKDFERAMQEYGRAMELYPENAEMIYWTAVGLASVGRVEESLPLFRKVFAADERWRTLTPRLPKAGLLPDDPALMQRILREGK